MATSHQHYPAFKELIKKVIRTFYHGECPPPDFKDADEGPRSKLAKVDTTGLGIVAMDYLLEHEWVNEELMCTDLGQHVKVLRRALKFLEKEHFLMCHSQRETKRSEAKNIVKQAVKAEHRNLQLAQGADLDDEVDEETGKPLTMCYWAIDFPRAFDMIQLRLYIMKKVLKDELDNKDVVAKYMCKAPHCNKEYTSFDIADILTFEGTMQCAMCGGTVEQVLASGQTGDEEQRKARKERIRNLFKKVEEELKSVNNLVNSLKAVQAPHHGTIQEWARLQQAREQGLAPAAGAGAGGAGGRADHRLRPHGVTQLTEAGGAARTAAYRETHLNVTIADTPVNGSGGSAAANGVIGVIRGEAAPSTQPFFLFGGKKSSDAGGDDGDGPAGIKSDVKEEPPAKRMRTDDSMKVETVVKAEAAPQHDEDWEDI